MPNSKAVDAAIDRERAKKLASIADPDERRKAAKQIDDARAGGNVAKLTEALRR